MVQIYIEHWIFEGFEGRHWIYEDLEDWDGIFEGLEDWYWIFEDLKNSSRQGEYKVLVLQNTLGIFGKLQHNFDIKHVHSSNHMCLALKCHVWATFCKLYIQLLPNMEF
jgi:hypothetical protein